MPEIRALIVDDEPLARRGIRQLLAGHLDFTVVGECRDGPEAVKALARQRPDVVFLDVQMPGMNGLQVLRLMGTGRMPLVVFVTAHEEFAVRAFDIAAIDYLVKPIGAVRFATAMDRVRARIRSRDWAAEAERLRQLEVLVAARNEDGSMDGLIAVRDGGTQLLLQPHEVDWIEADGYQAVVHSRGGAWRVRESLDSLEARLAPREFVRVHRGTIVRLAHVRELRTDPGTSEAHIILRDGTARVVSRRRLGALRRRLIGLEGGTDHSLRR